MSSRGIEDIYELTYIRKDGGLFPASVSITALRDDAGGVIGYLLMGTDNSARKRAESEVNAAMAAAEKANRAKTDFLSSMSHELRTPLNAILGFAQLMDSGTPPPTTSQKRDLDRILTAGWYLLDLINEILDLALIESGKVTLCTGSRSRWPRSCSNARAMVEPQAPEARRHHDVSAIRYPLLRQRRSNPGQAGADQPALQRDQVQQAWRRSLSNAP